MDTPAYPGMVKHSVRILKGADEKLILTGDTLVTRSIASGRTTLIQITGGILLGTGGRLQHGSPAARESC